MSPDQLMLELFNGLLAVQDRTNQILTSLTNPGIDWGDWLQLLAIIATAIGLFWQVNRQHKSNIEAQNDKIRTELKIQFRNDLEKHIEELTNATSEATVFPLTLKMAFSSAFRSVKDGVPPVPIRHRYLEFTAINARIGNASTQIISAIEKHLIIAPELDIFRMAMHVSMRDIWDAADLYGGDLLDVLPAEAIDQGLIYNPPLPNDRKMHVLVANGENYRHVVGTLQGWIYDLRVSIQKHALTGLFPDNRLECRKPLGKDEIVINPDDPEAVRRVQDFFENDTAWGRNQKEAKDWVRQENERKKAKAA